MTNKDFVMWLDGFLTNKKSLSKYDIHTIRNKIDDISDITPIAPYPTTVPNFPPFPNEPYCDTAKQLLKDDKRIH